MSYEVEILIGGRPARKYGHEGRTYVEAREGTEYSIRVKNNHSGRIEAVVAVDGLSVIDGKFASKSSTGYVIPGYNSYEVKGFRTSNDNVNAFRFAQKSASYAANSEEANFSDQNCGVIGVSIFTEKVKPQPISDWNYRPRPKWPKKPYDDPYYPPYVPPYRPPYYPPIWRTGDIVCSTSESAPSYKMSSGGTQSRSMNAPQAINFVKSSAAPASFDLGTEFSDKEVVDRVTTVDFKRGGPSDQFVIYYASRQQLEAMGVPLDKEVSVNRPSAFPKDDSGYCKRPTRRI